MRVQTNNLLVVIVFATIYKFLVDKDVKTNRNFSFGFSFSFGFGFGMICPLVSVSVLVQTKPKFRYFGFSSNSGFGRSLVSVPPTFSVSVLPSMMVSEQDLSGPF
jgi:hypothetical protein